MIFGKVKHFRQVCRDRFDNELALVLKMSLEIWLLSLIRRANRGLSTEQRENETKGQTRNEPAGRQNNPANHEI